MNFKFNIIPTKDIPFIPTDLQIYVGSKETIDVNGVPTDVVNVQTVLTQNITGGTLTEDKQHKFPVAFMDVIDHLDANKKPAINTAVLDQILKDFGLKLA